MTSYTAADMTYLMAAMKLTTMLGRKFDCQIVFGGHPRTDGKRVVLPFWDLSTPEARSALYGCVAHEAGGHVRMTDFLSFSQAVLSKPPAEQLTFKSILNILEDVRIEGELLKEYPGMHHYLDAVLHRYLVSEPAMTDTSSYWPIVLIWLLYALRHDVLGQHVLAGHLEACTQAILCAGLLQADHLDDLKMLGLEVEGVGQRTDATRRVVTIADKVFTFLKRHVPHQGNDQGNPQGQPQTEGDQGDPQGQPQTQGHQDDPQGQPQTEGDQVNSQGHPQTAGDQGDPQGHPQTDGNQGDPQGQPQTQGNQKGNSPQSRLAELVESKAAAEICVTTFLESELGDLVKTAMEKERQNLTLQSKFSDLTGLSTAFRSEVHTSQTMAVAELLAKAQSLTARFTPAITPLLIGESVDHQRLKNGARLDPRLLSQAITSREPAVYRRRVIDEDESVAIHLLVDTSGSTQKAAANSQTVHEHLMIAALALTRSLDSFPEVRTALSCFPGADRLTSSICHMVKSSEETLNRKMRCLSPDGGTPLDRAMVEAGLYLLTLEKDRRIVIVLTDGKPDKIHETANNRRLLNSLGVEVVGLVIGDDPSYPRDLFDHSVFVTDVLHLPREMLSMVQSIIR